MNGMILYSSFVQYMCYSFMHTALVYSFSLLYSECSHGKLFHNFKKSILLVNIWVVSRVRLLQCCCECSLCILAHGYMHVYIGMEIPIHICSNTKLLGKIKFFSKVVVPVYIPSSSLWKFPLLHILTNTWNCWIFNIYYSVGYVKVSYDVLDFHFTVF